MATVLMNKDKKDKLGVNAPVFGAPSATGGQASTTTPTAGAPQFTNIQNLIAANKGSGTQLATKVGGNIQGQAQKTLQTQGQVSQAAEQAKTTETGRQDDASKIRDAVKSASTVNINQLTPDQINSARQFMTGDTTGITGAVNTLGEGLGQVQAKTQNLGQNVGALGTETGRAGLLNQIVNRPTYGRGMSALDQTLLQTEGAKQLGDVRLNALKSLQQAQAGQKGVEAYGDVFKKLATSAGELGSDITASGEASQKTLSDVIKERASGVNVAEQANLAGLQQRMQSGKLTNADYATLGINPDQDLYGLNIAERAGAIPQGTTQTTAGDVTTGEEAGSFNKLNQLLGIKADEVKAGTGAKSTDLSSVSGNIREGITQGKAGYEQAVSQNAVVPTHDLTKALPAAIGPQENGMFRPEDISNIFNSNAKNRETTVAAMIAKNAQVDPQGQQLFAEAKKSPQAANAYAQWLDNQANTIAGTGFNKDATGGVEVSQTLNDLRNKANMMRDFANRFGGKASSSITSTKIPGSVSKGIGK